MIGPNEINMLVQVNQKLKGKVEEFEKEKLRFTVVMAEARMGYETKIAYLENVLQKLLAQLMVQGMGGAGQHPEEDSQSNLQESQGMEQDRLWESNKSGMVGVSGDIGASQQSIKPPVGAVDSSIHRPPVL